MLALDDPLWAVLRHAFGVADDVPSLLRNLSEAPNPTIDWKAEPWQSLWSSLCHQGDVYTASYAAVPHIVDIAAKTQGPVDFSFFQLPAAIEVARQRGHGPEIPSELVEDYGRAIVNLGTCVSRHWNETWDKWTLLSALAAQAVAKGHIDVAEALLNLDDDWIAKIIDQVDVG